MFSTKTYKPNSFSTHSVKRYQFVVVVSVVSVCRRCIYRTWWEEAQMNVKLVWSVSEENWERKKETTQEMWEGPVENKEKKKERGKNLKILAHLHALLRHSLTYLCYCHVCQVLQYLIVQKNNACGTSGFNFLYDFYMNLQTSIPDGHLTSRYQHHSRVQFVWFDWIMTENKLCYICGKSGRKYLFMFIWTNKFTIKLPLSATQWTWVQLPDLSGW